LERIERFLVAYKRWDEEEKREAKYEKQGNNEVGRKQ
jgi:hypothetical protein